MKNSRILFCLFKAFLLVFLTSCGGGGGKGNSFSGGIEGTGSRIESSGPIDGFGSVIVNGVRYDTTNATITINESSGIQDDLAIGQVVVVTGSINEDGTNGTADSIDFLANIRGPISDINPLVNKLTILGQTVLLTNSTQLGAGIDLNQLEDLPENTFLEVSGLTTARGQIIATRVELIEPPNELLVIGKITNLSRDTTAKHFSLNELFVDYTNAIIELDTTTKLSNDLNVLVKGSLLEDNVFIAKTITEQKLSATSDITLDIEALVSSFTSIRSFQVADIEVRTTPSTKYINGTADILGLNSSINVKGRVNDKGILVAERIEYIPINIDILVTAPVTETRELTDESKIIVRNNEFWIPEQSIELLGLELWITEESIFEDKSTIATPFNSFENIQPGDTLDIRGIFDGRVITSTLITRLNPTETVRLRGLLHIASSLLLIVQGVPVTLDPFLTRFIDVNGSEISYFEFINKTSIQSVFVEGKVSNEEIAADFVQLIPSPNGSVLIGTSGGDELIGTALDDIIFGEGSDDLLIGAAGMDSLYGGDGDDSLQGDEGNDMLYGGDGHDFLIGGAGADFIDGGVDPIQYFPGLDTAIYLDSPEGVQISLDGSTGMGGHAEGDTIVNVARLHGSIFNDLLTGNDQYVELRGYPGNDILIAGTGGAELQGYAGDDELIGSAVHDALIGHEGDDQLSGGGGYDYLTGGPGADTIDGGDDIHSDQIIYRNSPAGITIILDGTTAGRGGDAEGDTIIHVNDIEGSHFDDQLTGNAFENQMLGNDGNDILLGGGADDELFGDDGDDQLLGGSGNDDLTGGPGADSIDGGDNIDSDTVFYNHSPTGITIVLDGTTGSDGDAEGDTISNVDRIEGSPFNDDITGNTRYNTLLGGDGNDILTAGSGGATLNGQAGNDQLHGSAISDHLYGGSDNDTMAGDEGSDSYYFYRGDGLDTIEEISTDHLSTDVVLFGNSGTYIAPENLWFAISGDVLNIYVIGTSDRIAISNWQNNAIEEFRIDNEGGLNDGETLLRANVQTLVDAMTSVNPVDGETLIISSEDLNAVIDVIRDNWN